MRHFFSLHCKRTSKQHELLLLLLLLLLLQYAKCCPYCTCAESETVQLDRWV